MKVLVTGATGNLGSRLIPALLAHNHTVVAFVRTPSKLTAGIKAHVANVVEGNAASAEEIAKAIIDNNCDALINTAGLANAMPWGRSALRDVFPAVLEGAVAAGKLRGAPLRVWVLGGMTALDAVNPKYMLCDYLPIFFEHRDNYQALLKVPKSDLVWSMLCPGLMTPIGEPKYPDPLGSADNLLVAADTMAGWTNQYWNIPLIGGYLNVMSQVGATESKLEDDADFIAKDLEGGIESSWAFKRVGPKSKAKEHTS